jgi:hypothetical protein
LELAASTPGKATGNLTEPEIVSSFGAETGTPKDAFSYNTETRGDMRFYSLPERVPQLSLFELFKVH